MTGIVVGQNTRFRGRKRPFLASKPFYGIPGLVVEFLAALFGFLPEAYGDRGRDDEEGLAFGQDQGFDAGAVHHEDIDFHSPGLAVDAVRAFHPLAEHGGRGVAAFLEVVVHHLEFFGPVVFRYG